MNQTSLQVQVRQDIGKQSAKRLRRQGMIPGVYYIHGQASVNFSVDAKYLRNTLMHKSSVIDVHFSNGDTAKCVVREVQWDPVESSPLHLDLMGVRLTEKIKVAVPVRVTGNAAGVKAGGVLQQLLRELEIECLPLDIPEAVTIDVSALEINQSVHVGDLTLEKIEILNQPEQVIVAVLPPRLEEAPAPGPVEEVKEPELIGHVKKEEEGAEEPAKKQEGKK
ncbi:MAG: 50S ribosomal protein L25 [bacterium]